LEKYKETKMSIGKMTVQDFCEKHNACAEGKAWAIKTGAENMAELWKRDDMRNEWRLWIFERSAVDKKTAVRFAVFCARQNWNLLTDQRSKDAILTAERWVDGNATPPELEAAWEAVAPWAALEAVAAARSAWAALEAGAARAPENEITTEARPTLAERVATWAAWEAVAATRSEARSATGTVAAARAAGEAREAQNEWLIKNVEL
jgi:hypothetical protein